MNNIAIIGFGRAGHSAACTLRKKGYKDKITIFTEQKTGVENPMLTTYFGSEKIKEQDVMPFGNLGVIAKELNIDIMEGTRVTGINPYEMTLEYIESSEKKETEKFDDIIIATGATPISPAFEADGSKMITIRNIEDARRMNYALHKGGRVLVVGCSMIGIKVVQGLSEHDARITFIDFADKVFPTAVIDGAEDVIAKRITDKGVELRLKTGISQIREIHSKDKEMTLEAEFTDGSKAEFDTIFLCMGTRANIDIVKDTPIETDRAIIVNDHMQTNIPHIYAAGDCVEAMELSTGRTMNVALWANAASQGRIAAENILCFDSFYEGNLICNITHFWNTDFVSIGNNKAEGKIIKFKGKKPAQNSMLPNTDLDNTSVPIENKITAEDTYWYFYAIVSDNKIKCVNIIDNPSLSGVFRDLMKKMFSDQPEGSELFKYSAGRFYLPENIIKELGQYIHTEAIV